jgi:hypothetical protein
MSLVDTRSCYVNMRVRAGLLVMGLALIVIKVGGPHKALVQAKTRIAVTAFDTR